MPDSSTDNPKVIHKGVIFQEHNTGVQSTRKLVAGRCQYLINRQVDGPIRIDESKLTYKEGMLPID